MINWAHPSLRFNWHLDRFNRSAGLKDVANRQTDTQTTLLRL